MKKNRIIIFLFIGLCCADVSVYRRGENGPSVYGWGSNDERICAVFPASYSENLYSLRALDRTLLSIFYENQLRSWKSEGVSVLSFDWKPCLALLLHHHYHAVLFSDALVDLDDKASFRIFGHWNQPADYGLHAAIFLHFVSFWAYICVY